MARPSLHGRIHGVPCAAHPPGQPAEMQLFTTNPTTEGPRPSPIPAEGALPALPFAVQHAPAQTCAIMVPRPRQDSAMQQYLLLIYIDPSLLRTLPIDDFNTLMRDCLAHADKLQAEGTLLAAQKLQPIESAQTLRVRDGHSRVLDGPFAETRELLAGFNLIVARDRDEAMRIAQGFPWARFGSIEVRPLEDMDAERERCGAPAAAMAAAVP